MQKKAWVIATAAAAAIAVVAGIIVVVATPSSEDPADTPETAIAEHDTAPATPEPTTPTQEAMQPTAEPNPGYDEEIDAPSGSIGFSTESQIEAYEVAGKAALAWVQYDSATGVEGRTEQLESWFPAEYAQVEPLLTRPEWRAKYNPNQQSRIDQLGVDGTSFTVGTAEQFDDGYVVVKVDVAFKAEWGGNGPHSSICTGIIPLKMAVPFMVNSSGTALVYDDSRLFEVTEPNEHACVKS